MRWVVCRYENKRLKQGNSGDSFEFRGRIPGTAYLIIDNMQNSWTMIGSSLKYMDNFIYCAPDVSNTARFVKAGPIFPLVSSPG
jgi:hypothetical protein